MNSLCRRVAQELFEIGVRQIVFCPGARNVELLRELASFELTIVSEERVAGFFALGRIAATHRPVAVVTTSGTAAGELLPSIMEAFHRDFPLVAVTCDRPRRFRGTGAPQATQQQGIFSHFVESAWDLEGDEEVGLSISKAPIHVNVCLEDPLRPVAMDAQSIQSEPQSMSLPPRTWVVVGELCQDQDRDAVRSFLKATGFPAYLEPLSGMREKDSELGLSGPARHPSGCQGILRIGGIPTRSLWRDLETTSFPVWSISGQRWSGLARPSMLCQGDIASELTKFSGRVDEHWLIENRTRSAQLERTLDELLDRYPYSEPALIRDISRKLPCGAFVYLGNSLPIREWDLVAVRDFKNLTFGANRGLNGIDGQVSSFLGQANQDRLNSALLGDLTVLYDAAGFQPSLSLTQVPLVLFAINNDGGRIFDRPKFGSKFVGSHGRQLKGLAELWGWDYQAGVPDRIPTAGHTLVELRPDLDQSRQVWSALA